jgi:signal transduction histidine kinase/tetratricopeptide (TPR) repeat protein
LKKYFCLAVALFLTATQMMAQGGRLDSLLKALDANPAGDSQYVNTLRLLGRAYRNNNSNKAIDYFTKAIEAAPGINSKIYIANLLYDRGHSYFDAGNFNGALADYIEVAKAFEETSDSAMLFEIYVSIGNVYSDLSNYQKVNEYYNKAEQFVDKKNDMASLATLYGQRGIIYDKRKFFDSALINFEKSLQISTQLSDEDAAMNVLSNIGLSYKHKGDLNKALFYYDSAIRVYKKMNNGDMFAGGALYNNLASAYSKAGRIKEAIAAFNTSIAYSKTAGGEGIEMENYINMADMYGSINDYKNQAFYLQKHYALKDSLFNSDNQNKITELENDYQLAKKNAEILKKDIEVSSANSLRNTTAIVGASVLLLAIGLFYFLSKSKKTNALLSKQNSEIDEQRNELEKLNGIKDRLFSIVSHDLRNPLAALQSYLSLSDNKELAAEKQAALKLQTRALLHQTTDLLDNLLNWAHSQMKGSAITIKQVEINPLIEDCVSLVQPQAEQKGITIHFENNTGQMALGDEHALNVVFRNLLTNAVKFTTNNGRIDIAMQQRNGMLIVAIKDTGIGMDAATIDTLLQNEASSTTGTNNEKGTGLGILLVQDLLKKMNGKLEVESHLNQGTTFYVHLEQL